MGVVQHQFAPHMRELQTSLVDTVARFYPDVIMSFAEEQVTLSSDTRSYEALRRIFQAMIANELSVQRSEPERMAVIERLLQ